MALSLSLFAIEGKGHNNGFKNNDGLELQGETPFIDVPINEPVNNRVTEVPPVRLTSTITKRLQLVQIVSSFIALILSIIAVVLVTTNIDINQSNHQATGSNITKVSVKCKDCIGDMFYTKHPHHHQKNSFNNIEPVLPCCELKSGDLNKVIQMEDKSKTFKKESNQPTGTSTPVSAHKYLLSSDKAMNFSNVDHVTVNLSTATNEKNSNNHARGVLVKDDGIEILHSGLYYVYSSLFYLPKTKVSSEHFPYQTWFHYVYRTRPNSPAMSSVILRTVFTCCPSCSESKDSVYTGGIFHLKAGDIIQVCLSGQGIMGTDTVQDSSFLGLFMLASGHSA